ncbi:putative tRNA pseudouridine synthase C25B8.05 [Cyphellophora attinorum]|uniref:Putative tRNA pseudouridine synthase C25B8.05 n=1 Tax=Cyphellophora attinorum TaxID=1664694 RepID=A0A0N0NPP5_9EURO|nr:putative tRNA pseudouridine synthase C25B8.05 [Phialophora attinorum]KPI42991.1 putative tRNA pseudouridine synthase C25B8.05 [Phialophora attinorum]
MSKASDTAAAKAPELSIAPSPADYASLSPSDLIARIHSLESQLAALRSSSAARPASPSPSPRPSKKRTPKPFNPSLHSTRPIALKFSYIGQHYNGYEHANGTVTPKPTIEEVLWLALRKARLISPVLGEGADQGVDVVWGEEVRRARWRSAEEGAAGEGKMRLEVNWDGCGYSKAGRTDRGVSAFGQVIGVRVRSKRKVAPVRLEKREGEEVVAGSRKRNGDGEGGNGGTEELSTQSNDDPTVSSSPALAPSDPPPPPPDAPHGQHQALDIFDPIADELPYISILNAILPPSIRILAWCPNPPPDFDARFSCQERQYKYFFTNPAFLPTPGPIGMRRADGQPALVREGWLDFEAMRLAAKKLMGLHDYRNFCKLDASKQMKDCVRRINWADVEEWKGAGKEVVRGAALSIDGTDQGTKEVVGVSGPKVYCFSVHGSAFLWHQVRCMVAILFLVGHGLEQPGIVDELLNIDKNPGKPVYEMADDGPLVLWDCVYDKPDQDDSSKLNWIYAGDAATIPSLTTKNDGKFGLGGLADTLWTQWRKTKLEETVTAGLLDLALRQGDGSALERGGFREPASSQRSAKVFDGGDNARIVGKYTPVMKKARTESLEAQNAKYLAGRGARRADRTPASGDD